MKPLYDVVLFIIHFRTLVLFVRNKMEAAGSLPECLVKMNF